MALDSDIAKYQLYRAMLCDILDSSCGHMNIYLSECRMKTERRTGSTGHVGQGPQIVEVLR
jgi:hypothetical protein